MEGNLQVFVSFVYICIADRDPDIKRMRVEIPLTGLTLPHCCAFPKPVPGFPTSCVMVFFCVQ